MILPTPPSGDEKTAYIGTRRFLFYVPSFIAFVLLVTGIFLFSFSNPHFYVYALFGAVITFYLGVSYFIGFTGHDFNFIYHKAIVRDWSAAMDRWGTHPSVDIFYCTCGEDSRLISNAMKWISKIEYKGRLNVFVLDDGASPWVRAYAETYGFNYIVRPDRPHLKKAGNLRHAFAQTSGDFILVLDADFCPNRDILSEMIPHMKKDERIGILQSPQYFTIRDGQSPIEKGAAYIQELFYRMIQVSRNHYDASICVGTCALYRRQALEPFGGTAPIGYSEDVHTGFQIMQHGWKVKYIPINLAKGVCPDTLPAFFMQQYRWAMGSITLFLNPEFWKSHLTVMQRLCYLSGMFYYMVTGVAVVLTPLPAMILLAWYPEQIMWFNAVFSVPSFLFGVFGVAMWTKAPFGWYAPAIRQVSFYAHLFAFKDKILGTLAPWESTGAVKKSNRFDSFYKLFMGWSLIQIVWAMGFVILRVQEFAFYHFLPTLFFSCFNAFIAFKVYQFSKIGGEK
jgi:cellulose synthase/poly-beta-1,6-N-acetylglucosamine synthase-like glycosyltransferase